MDERLDHLRRQLNQKTTEIESLVAAKERVSEAFTLLNTYSAHDSPRDLNLIPLWVLMCRTAWRD